MNHSGVVAAMDRANVDTDQIIPKQFLKRIERSGFGQYLFFDWRFQEDGSPNPSFELNLDRNKNASVLLARRNFGSGSSREHAVWSIEDYGIRCVIAPSYADIFYNNSFKNVGISLRDERPSIETMGRAAQRLIEISGEQVLPLEADISKAATRCFPKLQHQYGPLAEKIKTLGLQGADRLESLNFAIQEILSTDASDAPQRLGGEQSNLYDSLKWAADVKAHFDQGLERTLRELQIHRSAIASLPNSGYPGDLKTELAEDLSLLEEKLNHENFFNYSIDFNAALTRIAELVGKTAEKVGNSLGQKIKEAEQDLMRLPEWLELTPQEKNNLLADLEKFNKTHENNLAGLQALMNQGFALQDQVQDLKIRAQRAGQHRIQEKLKLEQEAVGNDGKGKISRSIKNRQQLTSLGELDALIKELQKLRNELAYAKEFELTFKLTDN